jgi:hypothetical protein
VEEVFEQNVQKRKALGEDSLPRGGDLGAYLHRYAPLLKDHSFQGEKEWRIISRPLMCSAKLFDFREGNSTLVPYYRLPLVDERQNIRIHEIVVGPTPNELQSQKSVKSFLVRHGLEQVPVELSRVPYRNW